MAKNERLNEEASLNNNLGSSTLKQNKRFSKSDNIAKVRNQEKK